MNNTFVTHPSVRIKGTENNYTPVQCFDASCPHKMPHMHCPFCVKSDCYQDPVILKAHYRVKHVDKGIDFAGLKILRCCDHCDIVGIIKGEKKFKGAHWHCYKCRNGFNRRDEAVKHYKTHFRNPQTTFQIQIAQEVNQPVSLTGEPTSDGMQEEISVSIHPVLTEAVMATATVEEQNQWNQTKYTLSNGKTQDGTVHVSVAANETVDTSDGQTIMIIQEEQLDSGEEVEDSYGTEIITSEEVKMMEEKQQEIENEKLRELQEKCQQLELEKAELKNEVVQLQMQIQMQSQEIAAAQKREQELLDQLSIPLDKGIQDILKQLEDQHVSLLHQQLAFLKRNYLPSQLHTNNFQTHESADTNTSLPSDNRTHIILISNPSDNPSDAYSELVDSTTIDLHRANNVMSDKEAEIQDEAGDIDQRLAISPLVMCVNESGMAVNGDALVHQNQSQNADSEIHIADNKDISVPQEQGSSDDIKDIKPDESQEQNGDDGSPPPKRRKDS